MAAQPGSDMPRASASEFMDSAVPMVLQWPALGAEAQTISINSSLVDLAGRKLPSRFPQRHAGPGELAFVIAVDHRAAGEHDGGQFTVAAAIRHAGVVLSQPVISTTPSSGYPHSISTMPR